MDRNLCFDALGKAAVASLSARRAWIEIFYYADKDCDWVVALRKESVDRNPLSKRCAEIVKRRSPQGERG